MRRVIGDAVISVGTLLVVLFVLVLFDDRVREEATRVFHVSSGPSGLAVLGGQTLDASGVVLSAARDLSIAHGPLTIFSVAAIVLVIFMLRT